MTDEEVEALLSKEVLDLYRDCVQRKISATDFLLKEGGKYPPAIRGAVAEQLESRKLFFRKHPSLCDHPFILENSLLQQSTPEEVAQYRASTIPSGDLFVDCTGGMGIDFMAISKKFKNSVFCEMMPSRAKIFRENFKSCFPQDRCEVVVGDSISFVESSDSEFDYLFVDPARRDYGSDRTLLLESSSPNIVAAWSLLCSKAFRIGVKLSPLFDIDAIEKSLPGVTKISVISLNGEVKEIYVECQRDEKGVVLEAVLLKKGGAVQVISAPKSDSSPALKFAEMESSYIYLSDSALLKSTLPAWYADIRDLSLLTKRGEILTSQTYSADFPGRSLRVLEGTSGSKKHVARFLKERGVSGATVVSRGGAQNAADLRKLYSLKESERIYLIFFENYKSDRRIVLAERIFDEETSSF